MRRQNGGWCFDRAARLRSPVALLGVGLPPLLTHSFCREIGHLQPFIDLRSIFVDERYRPFSTQCGAHRISVTWILAY